MHIRDLIDEVNRSVEELDLVAARKYIEENLEILNEQKTHLKRNARELLKVLTEMQKSGYKPLSRQELSIIQTINSYASKFDLRGLKILVKDNAQLLLREDVLAYLNADAKIILEGMGAIVNHSGASK
ncbi:hypothetical protein ACLM5H_21410 [Fredinandcohnia humi]